MKTAIVTGANSGIGLALCGRLLTLYPDLKLCMVCRNEGRAQAARRLLLSTQPDADIKLVLCDIGCLKSVRGAVSQIQKIFEHVDYLFLNAGVMPSPKVNWWNLMATFVMPWKMVERFTTGRDLLIIGDGNTDEGFKLTFATNVLGHFFMVQELLDVLGGERSSQVIWTSSRNANGEIFSLEDLQHEQCIDPYASSKYLQDTLSIEMNEKLRNKNIYTQTLCPGVVMSGLTEGIFPSYVWSICEPFAKCLRFVIPSVTWEPYNGAEAFIWLTKQDVAGLDSRDKYLSSVSALGYPYCSTAKISVREGEPEAVYEQLTNLINAFFRGE